MTAQVEDAVDDCLGEIMGRLGTDDHIAQLARAAGRSDAVEGKGQNVGHRVATAMVAIEAANSIGPDQLDRQMAVNDADGPKGGLGRAPEQRVVVA